MARVALDGRILVANRAFCSMLGYDEDELRELTATEITHPEDREESVRFSKSIWSDSSGAVLGTMQKRYLRKDGRVLHAELNLTTIRKADGSPSHSLVQLSSIEERWHLERVEAAHKRVLELLTEDRPLDAVLHEVLSHTESVCDSLRAMILLTSDDGLSFSRSYAVSFPRELCDVLQGSEVREGLGSCATGIVQRKPVIVDDTESSPLWEPLRDLAEEFNIRSCWSQPVIGSDDRVLGSLSLSSRTPRRPTDAEVSFIEGMARLVAIAIERHRVLEALRMSRARFKTLVEHAPEAVVLFDYDACRFIEANSRVQEIYKADASALLAADLTSLSPARQPDGRASAEAILKMVEEAKAGGTPAFNWVALDFNGDEVHCEIRLVRLPTQSGTLIRGSITDIGERIQAEQALRANKESLHATLDSIGDAVVSVDSTARIVHFNPVAEQLFGLQRQEAVDRPLDEVVRLFDPTTREPVDPFGRRPKEAEADAHLILSPVHGDDVLVMDRVTPIKGREGEHTGTVFVFRDVTKQREAQERLLQVRKLEAIGQLAGGVAHDFNNLLTGILGNAELLDQSEDPATSRAASMITLAARRAADLTGQLLRFSRNEPPKRDLVNIHGLIVETCQLLEHSMDKRIELGLELKASNPVVMGDASQLQNAFLNLGLNARDALQGSGSLTISTANTGGASPSIEITFADTGVGIEPDVLEHIFEPFFTTKEVGLGTGLGLAGTYGIVHNHGGRIEVGSTPGKGARFTISLPGAEAPPLPAPPTVDRPTRGEGTILVVDDEELVRSLVIRALESFGYQAVGAADGLEAERMMTRGAFDLVILDLVMPKRSGLETYQVLSRIDPTVPIMVASGFSRDHSVEEVLDAGAVGFLHKPFSIAELSASVTKALGGCRA